MQLRMCVMIMNRVCSSDAFKNMHSLFCLMEKNHEIHIYDFAISKNSFFYFRLKRKHLLCSFYSIRNCCPKMKYFVEPNRLCPTVNLVQLSVVYSSLLLSHHLCEFSSKSSIQLTFIHNERIHTTLHKHPKGRKKEIRHINIRNTIQ